ncbi:MAG: tripartite tricarboxylate transporter substrate binding protein [Armatimonadota bacterium]|nr:tripartite tricarboxylate transporter substrate binding protein [Armatimonadota bacterium]MDR5702707.1 tripartite tricarboxylate transporter substrate binding protein [Armatimonadota bacterium]
MKRWIFLFLSLLVLALPGLSQEAYPTKPIELIIPFAAGGSHDLHARVLASVAPQYLGQPLVVILKPGAGGAIACQYVARAKGDGYTLLFGGTGPNTILPQVENVGYGMKEFTPIALINYSPALLTVRADAPWKTAAEFVEYAKNNPGKVNFAHTGIWGASHFPMLMIEAKTGAKVNFIPTEGGGPALLAVASGNADASFLFAAQVLPFLRAGRVRVLGVTSPSRIDPIKEIPTLKEQGIDVTFVMWRAVLAPSSTPVVRVKKLREAFKKMVADPSFKALIAQLGEPIIYMDGPEFLTFWRKEWEDVSKTLAAIKK